MERWSRVVRSLRGGETQRQETSMDRFFIEVPHAPRIPPVIGSKGSHRP
ncbi:MAG: hypothetical protein GF346_01660 [Candidatus Eisenbacteria bacterium]|nr:hypothetical protein [Candidatus Latescibacterota bacterium]MBD3301137.1 hypothetical protein [Candidatus Eisenbacteria bacterium]